MENRDLRWIGLGLGSPTTLFSPKKVWFLGYFWPFSIIWGFPPGGPILAYVALCMKFVGCIEAAKIENDERGGPGM